MMINYLIKNTGKAYTPNALFNKLEVKIRNSTARKYLKKNGEEIFNKMISHEDIQTTQKDGVTHYFFPIKS